jgi:hypothetical protein
MDHELLEAIRAVVREELGRLSGELLDVEGLATALKVLSVGSMRHRDRELSLAAKSESTYDLN